MRKYLLKPDRFDHRDMHYAAELYSHVIPTKVDLRDKMSPVVDQGQLGSCTANAIASGLREFLLLKSGQPLTRLSRLFLYWQERSMEGTVEEDSGAYIRDGMKALTKIGICPESDYPYDISRFTETPDDQDYQNAAQYKISGYHRVLTLHSLKSALAKGSPVVFGMILFESFESQEVARTGIVPMPHRGEQQLGGHAMCFVGYDDEKQHLIVRNSWGEGWGDKGYCYIPYDMVTYRYVTDMWCGQ